MRGGYVGRGQSTGRQRLFSQVNVNRCGRAREATSGDPSFADAVRSRATGTEERGWQSAAIASALAAPSIELVLRSARSTMVGRSIASTVGCEPAMLSPRSRANAVGRSRSVNDFAFTWVNGPGQPFPGSSLT
jgi:hypothetical protein